MKNQSATSGRQAQQGYALLATFLIAGIAAAATATTLGNAALANKMAGNNAAVLAQAKQALISRAASDANHPGSLPCPDALTHIPGSNVPNDGIADLLSGAACPSNIGRLPWRTLGLPDLRDADGERLWYMLSPAYHDSPSKIINPGTSGQIAAYECADDTPVSQAWPCNNPRVAANTPWVAVIFSPGRTLGAQSRDSAHVNDVAQYLEAYNPADPLRLRLAAGASGNDRVAAISAEDIFAIVQRRVAGELQTVLAKYIAATVAQGRIKLPAPAASCNTAIACASSSFPGTMPATSAGFLPSDDSLLNQFMTAQNMAWFDHNHWRTTITFTRDNNCSDQGDPAICGSAFSMAAGQTVPAGTTIVGSASNSIGAGTRAVVAFAGGTAKTQIAFVIQ